MKRLLWIAAAVVVGLAVWMVGTCLIFRPEYALKRYMEAFMPSSGWMVGMQERNCKCLPPHIPAAARIEIGPASIHGLWATVPVRVVGVTGDPRSPSAGREITGQFLLTNEFGWRVAYMRSSVGGSQVGVTSAAGAFDPKTSPIVVVR